jgi:thiosulfate dehydrogenase [quinone] large subunit
MTNRLTTTVLGREYTLELSAGLVGYWSTFLRLLGGWWFFTRGLGKYANLWSRADPFSAGWFLEIEGTLVSPILNAFVGGATEAFVNVTIPIAEVLIGLALLLGVLTRFAASWAAIMMFFFYFGNEAWRDGYINGDLLGLVLFLTILVFGAGRVLGLDAYLERTAFVDAHPWLRYLLG